MSHTFIRLQGTVLYVGVQRVHLSEDCNSSAFCCSNRTIYQVPDDTFSLITQNLLCRFSLFCYLHCTVYSLQCKFAVHAKHYTDNVLHQTFRAFPKCSYALFLMAGDFKVQKLTRNLVASEFTRLLPTMKQTAVFLSAFTRLPWWQVCFLQCWDESWPLY